MNSLDSIKGQIISDFETSINDFISYYTWFNTTNTGTTQEFLQKKEESFLALFQAINRLKKKQSLFELEATKKQIETYETIIRKAVDFGESCGAFITLRQKLLTPSMQEARRLTNAYDAGWTDYRQIIYHCHKLYGEPLSMQEIIDWGPEWYVFESFDIPLGGSSQKN